MAKNAEATKVWIGEDHFKHLEAIAEAASDLKLGNHDSEFAELNGGKDSLEWTLFQKVFAWESFASEHLSEEA